MQKATDTFRHLIYRHNCAQAIANKWRHLYPQGDAIVKEYAPYKGGLAPGGVCGALYAAMQAVPDRAAEIERRFVQAVGHTHCRDIKLDGRVPCEKCVDTADNILETLCR